MPVKMRGPHSMGLMCRECNAHAYILGFRTLAEAQDYARHVLGWTIGDMDGDMVSCPECGGNSIERVAHGKETAEKELHWRVHDALRKGRNIVCTAEEWPEARAILAECRERWIEERKFVLAGQAQDQEERLRGLYGSGGDGA